MLFWVLFSSITLITSIERGKQKNANEDEVIQVQAECMSGLRGEEKRR